MGLKVSSSRKDFFNLKGEERGTEKKIGKFA